MKRGVPILNRQSVIISNRRVFVTSDGYRLHKEGKIWTDGDLEFDDQNGHPVDFWGNRLEGHFTG